MAARCDLTHVPDHRALRVEIGGADEEPPSFHVLGGHLFKKSVVDVKGDHSGEGRIARKRLPTKQSPDRPGDGNVACG
jgi:hypothetical protein